MQKIKKLRGNCAWKHYTVENESLNMGWQYRREWGGREEQEQGWLIRNNSTIHEIRIYVLAAPSDILPENSLHSKFYPVLQAWHFTPWETNVWHYVTLDKCLKGQRRNDCWKTMISHDEFIKVELENPVYKEYTLIKGGPC